MSEQEQMDGLLRAMMTATPVPSLSAEFEQRMRKRLRPRRLDAVGRRWMTGYAIVALMLSVWVMRSQAVGWGLVGLAIVVPLMVVGLVRHNERVRS